MRRLGVFAFLILGSFGYSHSQLVAMNSGTTDAVVQTSPAQHANVHLPNESAGNDAIARTLLSAFDQVDIVALGEGHAQFEAESDMRIALIRNPDFAKKVHFIVVEFASATEQATLDRYIQGGNVSADELAQVWKTATQGPNGLGDSPIYAAFFAAVRDVNSRLAPAQQIRFLGGDPGLVHEHERDRDDFAVDLIREQVLQKHGKALLIWGDGHFYRADPRDYVGIVTKLEPFDPGRILSVITLGHLNRPRAVAVDLVPDFHKIDSAIKSPIRPVLVPLDRLPLRDLSAEEFLGRHITTCLPPGGCRSLFKGSTLTLGQMADAAIYYGGGEDIGQGR
jgi:hypothetical protein